MKWHGISKIWNKFQIVLAYCNVQDKNQNASCCRNQNLLFLVIFKRKVDIICLASTPPSLEPVMKLSVDPFENICKYLNTLSLFSQHVIYLSLISYLAYILKVKDVNRNSKNCVNHCHDFPIFRARSCVPISKFDKIIQQIL